MLKTGLSAWAVDDLGVSMRMRYGFLLNNFTETNKLPVFRTESQYVHQFSLRTTGYSDVYVIDIIACFWQKPHARVIHQFRIGVLRTSNRKPVSTGCYGRESWCAIGYDPEVLSTY
jgi:hypothetical protein